MCQFDGKAEAAQSRSLPLNFESFEASSSELKLEVIVVFTSVFLLLFDRGFRKGRPVPAGVWKEELKAWSIPAETHSFISWFNSRAQNGLSLNAQGKLDGGTDWPLQLSSWVVVRMCKHTKKRKARAFGREKAVSAERSQADRHDCLSAWLAGCHFTIGKRWFQFASRS